MKKRSLKHPVLRFLFICYCLVMLWLLFGREFGWVDHLSYKEMLRFNIKPLYTIKNYLRVIEDGTTNSYFGHCLINLTGNIFLFIPIGFLMPFLWSAFRKFYKFLFVSLLVILIIESIQLFLLLGCCDIDDVILNTTGFIIGYFIWTIFK